MGLIEAAMSRAQQEVPSQKAEYRFLKTPPGNLQGLIDPFKVVAANAKTDAVPYVAAIQDSAAPFRAALALASKYEQRAFFPGQRKLTNDQVLVVIYGQLTSFSLDQMEEAVAYYRDLFDVEVRNRRQEYEQRKPGAFSLGAVTLCERVQAAMRLLFPAAPRVERANNAAPGPQK